MRDEDCRLGAWPWGAGKNSCSLLRARNAVWTQIPLIEKYGCIELIGDTAVTVFLDETSLPNLRWNAVQQWAWPWLWIIFPREGHQIPVPLRPSISYISSTEWRADQPTEALPASTLFFFQKCDFHLSIHGKNNFSWLFAQCDKLLSL